MKSKQISVLIPVYRESNLLKPLLKRLLSQKIEKEIFVIADEPTKKTIEISKEFKEVTFILNKERIGKVQALNKAAKLSSGKILLFLDDDIELPDDQKFLEKITEEMRDTDILDIKKEVVKTSFLSRMTYYDYVGLNIGSWLVAKFLKKCPAMNGSAFAMRRNVFNSLKGFRRVITEDLDIAFRGFLENFRYKYTKKVKVYNQVPSNRKNWIIQRKRWATGAALWFKEWYKPLLKESAKHPQIFVPALFFLFPSLVLLLTALLTPNLLIYKLFSIFFLFLAIKFNFALPFLLFTTLSIDILKGLFASLISFLSFSVLFFTSSKKLGLKFKIHEFFVYYFTYSLLSLLVTIVGFIKVFVFKRKSVSDWKI